MKRLTMTVAGAAVLAFITWATLYTYNTETPVRPVPVQQIDQALYVKIAAVYEGEFNGSPRATVSKEFLDSSVASFVNVPMLLAHEYRDLAACVGRTVSSRVAFDSDLKKYYIEVVAKIVDPLAIEKIKKGLYYSVSIGFAIEGMTCSIDSLDTRDCPHTMGKDYKVNGVYVTARAIFKTSVGLEISFVNVPGSRGARVLNYSNDAASLSASK